MSRTDPHSPNEAYDQWLVLCAQSGDEEALRRLVDRWNPHLQRHASRLTGNPDGAADVAQEAWLAIVRGLKRLDDPACFRRWAYQIVTRKCADWVRGRQRRRATTETLVADPEHPEPTGDPHEPVARLRAALAELASDDRTILAMHYLDGMPLTEIAESLLLPVGTVKSRLFHARKRLKAVLENDEG